MIPLPKVSTTCMRNILYFTDRECFTCTHCNNQLAGQRFTSKDDKPYCADCYGELFAKRCTACVKPITGKFIFDISCMV